MFKKIVLLTAISSLLTVGCATTQTPKAAGVPVKYDRVVVVSPTANTNPTKQSPAKQPMVKLVPATAVSTTDRQAILSCIELIKPRVVRPLSIKPDLTKTEIERGDDGSTLVKMPFTVTNNFDEPALILAACWSDSDGNIQLELADM